MDVLDELTTIRTTEVTDAARIAEHAARVAATGRSERVVRLATAMESVNAWVLSSAAFFGTVGGLIGMPAGTARGAVAGVVCGVFGVAVATAAVRNWRRGTAAVIAEQAVRCDEVDPTGRLCDVALSLVEAAPRRYTRWNVDGLVDNLVRVHNHAGGAAAAVLRRDNTDTDTIVWLHYLADLLDVTGEADKGSTVENLVAASTTAAEMAALAARAGSDAARRAES